MTLIRRLLVVASYAIWIGGLAFYGSVVIPIGTRVVGSHTVQGLVTAQVTWVVNLISVPALAVLLWNVVIERRHASRVRWVTLWATWGVMLVVQISLFVMHPALNQMLDQQARSVLNRSRFDLIHESYIRLTAVQHAAGLVHLWLVLLVWTNRQQHGPLSQAHPQVKSGVAMRPTRA